MPTLALNEEVDMRVVLTNEADRSLYVVIAERCWATPTSDPEDATKYTLEFERYFTRPHYHALVKLVPGLMKRQCPAIKCSQKTMLDP